MDLFDALNDREDPNQQALDRLESIVILYQSEDEAVQDEALARAITLCGRQWGSYAAGMEALAERFEQQGRDEMDCLRWRSEAHDPGSMILLARLDRFSNGRHNRERSELIARYGSEDAVLAPSAMELIFIHAAAHLADSPPVADQPVDPWASLSGWSLPWHPIPDSLRLVIEHAIPLPATLADARREVLDWEARQQERACLAEDSRAALPTACMARLRLVGQLWRKDLPACSIQDVLDRLEYWQQRGGDDGTGYGVLARDVQALLDKGQLQGPQPSTKEKAHALKEANPTWSLARIGLELGISRQAVHKHLKG